MSVLSLTEARAAGLGEDLEAEALQDAIDEEEAWLTRRIGQLVGLRTQRFPLAYLRPTVSEVHLARPTVIDADFEPRSDGTVLEVGTYELRPGGWVLALLPEGTRYVGITEVTYVPADELEVRRALKELVGLQLGKVGASGTSMEQIGTYMYQRAPAAASARARAAVLRSLREPRDASSMRMLPSRGHGLAGTLGR